MTKRAAFIGIWAVVAMLLGARAGAEERVRIRPKMAVFLAKALGLQWPWLLGQELPR